jgi:hypothetical protein
VPRHVARLVTRLVVDYFDYAARPVPSARRAACRRLLRLRRASGCLGTSCGSSPDSLSTTSSMPRVQVPRHVTRLVTWLVALLVVDYSAYAVRPVASARCAACHPARHRLLHLLRESGCLGTSHGSSSTTSTTPRIRVHRHVAQLVKRLVAPLVVDYSAYAVRPGASAHRAARHPARHRLLHLRRASGCFGTSSGLSRDSSSTTSPRAGSSSTTSRTLSVRVPRHAVRLVTRLIVDYFDYAACPGASARRAAFVEYFDYAARPGASTCRVARHRLLRLRRASGCPDTARSSSPGSSSTTSPTPRVRLLRHVEQLVTRLIVDYFASRKLVVDYLAYAERPGA